MVAALPRGNEDGAVPKNCRGSGGFGGSNGSSGGSAPTSGLWDLGVRDKAQGINRQSISPRAHHENAARFGNLYKRGGRGILRAPLLVVLASLIDRPLLTPAEVLWVDDYHATVWDRVSPLLAEGCEGRRWLREATRPLEGEAALAGGGSGEEAVAV